VALAVAVAYSRKLFFYKNVMALLRMFLWERRIKISSLIGEKYTKMHRFFKLKKLPWELVVFTLGGGEGVSLTEKNLLTVKKNNWH
jgi:hypothetical protein